MKITYKNYKCSCCCNEKKIQTNHFGNVYVYCPNCSWKAFQYGEDKSIATPEHRHSRRHECLDKEE